MASPLLPYQNARLLVEADGGIVVNNGRIECEECDYYLVTAFLKRQQGTSTSTGGTGLPGPSGTGFVLPGAAGESYLYRGYCLQYASVPSTYDLKTGTDAGLRFFPVKTQLEWLLPGRNGSLKFGSDPILYVTIERSSGVFGGSGIDELVYSEIGGVLITLTAAELQN